MEIEENEVGAQSEAESEVLGSNDEEEESISEDASEKMTGERIKKILCAEYFYNASGQVYQVLGASVTKENVESRVKKSFVNQCQDKISILGKKAYTDHHYHSAMMLVIINLFNHNFKNQWEHVFDIFLRQYSHKTIRDRYLLDELIRREWTGLLGKIYKCGSISTFMELETLITLCKHKPIENSAFTKFIDIFGENAILYLLENESHLMIFFRECADSSDRIQLILDHHLDFINIFGRIYESGRTGLEIYFRQQCNPRVRLDFSNHYIAGMNTKNEYGDTFLSVLLKEYPQRFIEIMESNTNQDKQIYGPEKIFLTEELIHEEDDSGFNILRNIIEYMAKEKYAPQIKAQYYKCFLALLENTGQNSLNIYLHNLAIWMIHLDPKYRYEVITRLLEHSGEKNIKLTEPSLTSLSATSLSCDFFRFVTDYVIPKHVPNLLIYSRTLMNLMSLTDEEVGMDALLILLGDKIKKPRWIKHMLPRVVSHMSFRKALKYFTKIFPLQGIHICNPEVIQKHLFLFIEIRFVSEGYLKTKTNPLLEFHADEEEDVMKSVSFFNIVSKIPIELQYSMIRKHLLDLPFEFKISSDTLDASAFWMILHYTSADTEHFPSINLDSDDDLEHQTSKKLKIQETE